MFLENKSHDFVEASEYFNSLSVSLDNLLRLNLVEILEIGQIQQEPKYTGYTEKIIESYNERIREDISSTYRYEIKHNWFIVKLTDFGLLFCNVALGS